MLEVKVLRLDVIYSTAFGQWCVRINGLLNHPDGERNITVYSERFGSEVEAVTHMATLSAANRGVVNG